MNDPLIAFYEIRLNTAKLSPHVLNLGREKFFLILLEEVPSMDLEKELSYVNFEKRYLRRFFISSSRNILIHFSFFTRCNAVLWIDVIVNKNEYLNICKKIQPSSTLVLFASIIM